MTGECALHDMRMRADDRAEIEALLARQPDDARSTREEMAHPVNRSGAELLQPIELGA